MTHKYPKGPRLRLGFLTSHGGSNMQSIIDACVSGDLEADPVVAISNNSGSEALARARAAGIPTLHLSGATHPDPGALDAVMADSLSSCKVDVVCLAGYMKKIGPKTLDRFQGRIINIHPSLLPKHGGPGMYGLRVHEAVLAAGEKVSGATVHLVDASYDTGPVLAQTEVDIRDCATAEEVAGRVLKAEHALYVQTLKQIAAGHIELG